MEGLAWASVVHVPTAIAPPLSGPKVQTSRGALGFLRREAASGDAWPLSFVAGAVTGGLFLGSRGRRASHRTGLWRQRQSTSVVRCAEGEAVSAEEIFREAFDAEDQRAGLLVAQLEALLSEQLGVSGGVRIAVQGTPASSPLDDSSLTWRQAYEAVKVRTKSLEEQLRRAKGMAQPSAPPPPPPPAASTESRTQEATSRASSDGFEPFQVPGSSFRGDMDPMQQVQRLREVASTALDEESVLRLIAVAALPSREAISLVNGEPPEPPGNLPSLDRAKGVLSQDFSVANTITFDRCYIFNGTVVSGREPGSALEAMQDRMRSLGAPGANETELYLQPAKEAGRSLVIMLHKSDLPSTEIPWWQYALFVFLVLFSFLASSSTTFAVVPIEQNTIPDTQAIAIILKQYVPTAAGIMATVVAQESARRAVAFKYGVELTPPFLVPTWPIASIGCLGGVTRHLSAPPNREAEYTMSAAAGIAGYIVSLLLVAVGLSMGPDPAGVVNLNYQLLPVVMKLLLRPFLGTSSISNQPDPFTDPTLIAFPANPVLIGGVVGLLVTSLSLLPIGRLDGGVLARNALGSAAGPLGILGFLLLIIGSFAPDDQGNLYLSFGVAAIVWQGGSELPPKEAITGINDGQKALALVLLAAGFLLTIPGWGFPTI